MDPTAGFWVRLPAFIIDNFIVVFVYVIVLAILFREDTSDFIDSSNFENLLGLASTVYFTAFIAVWTTTAGKRLFGLYVVRTDGSRVGFGRALARSIATGLSSLILGIGFLMVAFREDKRALHDLICDTKVIKRNRRPSG